VCGIEIEVPFKPDGKRPTFCREHFKSFQRTVARTRTDPEPRHPFSSSSVSSARTSAYGNASSVAEHAGSIPSLSIDERRNREERKDHSTIAPRAYVSPDVPLSLNQMQHIAPKPFRRIKETIDLGEVRKILSSERTEKNDEHSHS
jgi:CxxC-x17-CxxC domain-containing protein